MRTIRYETSEDYVAIRTVHTEAFGRLQEADLVDALRRAEALTISLVAVQDGHIVGHIALSPVTVTSSTTTIEALGLAPLAVLPAYQRNGKQIPENLSRKGCAPIIGEPRGVTWGTYIFVVVYSGDHHHADPHTALL